MKNEITRKLSHLRINQVLCGLIPTVLVLAAGTTSSRAGVTITAIESGGDVVISGSGTLNLTAWSISAGYAGYGSGVVPAPTDANNSAYLILGPSGGYGYHSPSNFNGPTSFGTSTTYVSATTVTGQHFGMLLDTTRADLPQLHVPGEYISGSALFATSTFAGQTFASLGMTPGSYTWSWGSGGSTDSMQFNVVSGPTGPTLTISQASGTVTVGWDPQAGTLQSAPALSGPWSNVTTNSPYATPATNSAAYYRVELP